MAKPIVIKLDTSRYKAPTQEDIKAAKQYILQREEYAHVLEDGVDEILEDAAARIVTICYRFDYKPEELVFSSSFNEEMMNEISDTMDEIESEIYDLIFEYSTRSTNDRDIMSALALWMATLGRGNRNLRDTLDGYLYKFMKDIEASVAAYRFMGVSQTDAVTKIRSNLHNIYNQPEVLTAFRRKQNFNATYIRLGGVQPGAVGISNNGSTNVVSMSKITLQMAWMRAQAMEWEKDDSISGYYQLRGSSYLCDLCDEEVGFHPNIEEIYEKSYPHSHCRCLRVPIHSLEELLTIENGQTISADSNSNYAKYTELKNDRNYYNVEYNEVNGGVKATHAGHNFDKKGGKYEKHVQNAGFSAGHVVILENERGGSFNERFTEGTWDGVKFEVAGRETATSNNILRGLKHCASKRDTVVAVLDFPNGGFDMKIFQNAIQRYKGLEQLHDGQYLKFKEIICVQNEKIVLKQGL